MYGLKEKHIKATNSVFSKYPQIEKTILYGSRAKGNYRNGSDIDLTLVGDDLDLTTLFKIETELDDLLLPYKMDLSILHKIENQDLVDHINRVGITFYKKMTSEWKEYILEVFAEINPTERIPKGTIAKKIAMEVLQPFTKRVASYSEEEYKGGTKFRNGDTIMARITPSLENGKTSFVDILDDGEIGFGSTEYIVFREREGISDKDFIYYLTTSPIVRNTAIKSMTGSSGRQRVQTDVVKNHNILVPDLPEQKQIAEILTSLDDKIDLLHRQNKTLEAMAETLYESWVFEEDFDSTIKDLIDIQNGYAFKSKSFQDNGTHRVLKIKNISGGIVNIQTTDFVSDETVLKIDKKFKIKTGDVLFAMTGAKIGKMGIIPQTEYSLWLNQRVGLFKEKVKGSRFLAYLHLKSDYGFDYIENTATGSAQPNISGTGIENCEFPKFTKEEIKEFSIQLELMYEKVFFNLGQVRKLEQIRETLLPQLMSGEIKVVANE